MKSPEKIIKIRADITGLSRLKQRIFKMPDKHLCKTLEDKVEQIVQFIGTAQKQVDVVMLSGSSLYGGTVTSEMLRQAVSRGCSVSIIVPDDTNHEKLVRWQQDQVMVYTAPANNDQKYFVNFSLVDMVRYQYEVPNDAENNEAGMLITLHNPKTCDWDAFKMLFVRAFNMATRLRE